MLQPQQLSRLLQTVKTDKNITDQDLDNILTSFIQQASDMVCLYVNEDELPNILETIVIQMTEAHYVKSLNDADGTTAYSEEGASWTFSKNDLDPFMDLLEKYLDNQHGNDRRGAVLSWY